jgi:hypothetical protein
MLVSDIQRQAYLYWNVLERVKSGAQEPTTIREQFERLELMPKGILPNPAARKLVQKAFDKLAVYRRALVDLVQRFGGELLSELSFELGLTVSLGVEVGFPPAVTIAIEHTSIATQTIETRYGARREVQGPTAKS